MKQLKRPSLAWLGIFISSLILLSACTPDDAASFDGQYGGEVVLGITQEPGLFDPHRAEAAGDREILFNIFEGLVKCTSNGEFVPALSTDYTISDDAMTYTFDLRDDVYFHNGKKMDASDVIYSLTRAINLEMVGLDNISDVRENADGQIVLFLHQPDSELLPFLTCAIIPDGSKDLHNDPIGTGPFAFDSYRVGQSVVLVRHDNYWQAEHPYLDKVTFKITADMDAAFLELKSGHIDIFPYLTHDKASQLEQDYTIVSGAKNLVQVFVLNNDHPPFDDPLVREAMNYAVDRDVIIAQTTEGYGEKLATGMSPKMGVYYDRHLDDVYTYDPQRAIDLLEQAGYPDGFSTSVTVPSNYMIHVNTAMVIAEQLKNVGIDLEIVSVNWPTWMSDVFEARQYASTVIALDSLFAPRAVLSFYPSDSEKNFFNYSNAEFDALYSQAPLTLDEDEKISLYHQMLGILVDDHVSVYLQDPMDLVAVKNGLSGYVVYPIYVQDLSTVYYET